MLKYNCSSSPGFHDDQFDKSQAKIFEKKLHLGLGRRHSVRRLLCELWVRVQGLSTPVKAGLEHTSVTPNLGWGTETGRSLEPTDCAL